MISFHDESTNTLIYDIADPQAVLPLLRDAKPLMNGYVAVPVSLHNMQIMCRTGEPIVPLVEQTYDWPIRNNWRPRDHQRQMTNFMVQHPKSFNLSEMGSQKTLATLWAADYVMRDYEAQGRRCRCLIICPLSIMQRVWGDALFNHFLGRRRFTILYGSHAKRRKQLEEDSDFYIVNYEGAKLGAKLGQRRGTALDGLSKDIADREDIKIVVIDEASAYRDGTTARHRVARKQFEHKPYLWLLTGTPTSNGPLDAHGLARLVNNAHGEPFTAYKQRVMFQVSGFKWAPKLGAAVEARKLLQPAVRFKMRECTDVPPCTEQMRDVELSTEQVRYFKRLQNDLIAMLDSGVTITAAHEGALRLKLIQISCGAVYDADHKAHPIDCSPRLRILREAIEEANRKCIIFTPLTSIVHMLFSDLSEYSRAFVNGEVPLKARNEIFQRFQTEDDPHVIIADPATMSHGLDLFRASVIVWYGATDRTELYLQANSRIDRPGQTVPTTIVQLAASAVEREIYRRAAANITMQGVILDLVRNTK